MTNPIALENFVKAIPDFPKEGITFRDISPLLANADAYRHAIEVLKNKLAPTDPEVIVGLDARGFLIGPLLAQALGVPFVMARKAGKLPGDTVCVTYKLEYGTAELEMQKNAFPKNSHVVVVDDVLATGGTAEAACKLVELLGGHVHHCAFLIEIEVCEGRACLGKYNVDSLLKY